MEEELQKRNTDCVYFLASPLTCRKGAECEYRHSEAARLNPRDCWYWLSGNCLNPSCTFRHPPLEKPGESAAESDTSQHQASLPTNKTNVPCYFYFNGFCNKGDKCSFSHGPDTFTGKYVKTPSAVTDGFRPDSKTSVGSEAALAPKKVHATPTEAVQKAVVDLNVQLKDNVRQTDPKKVIQESLSERAVSQDEEAAVINSSSMLPADDLIQSNSYLGMYQNSEEYVDDHVEPDERLESSPGFDVLVDDKSEYLGYGDDEENPQAVEREDRQLGGHFLRDDFAEPAEYDPAYPEMEHFYEGEMIDSYCSVDNMHVYDDLVNDSGDGMLVSALSRKRKLLPLGTAINGQRAVDLRDCLRKHRISGGHPGRSGSSNDSSLLRGSNEKRPRRHGISQRLRERLVLEVGNIGYESLEVNGTVPNGGNQRGQICSTQLNKSRQCYHDRRRAKRQFLQSEVSRRPGPRDKRSSEEPVMFSGPKTLAQLKEEKKKAEENGESCSGFMVQSSGMNSADFEGPKPLSEILKDKRTGSVVAASES